MHLQQRNRSRSQKTDAPQKPVVSSFAKNQLPDQQEVRTEIAPLHSNSSSILQVQSEKKEEFKSIGSITPLNQVSNQSASNLVHTPVVAKTEENKA
jgi:hypothetical protein